MPEAPSRPFVSVVIPVRDDAATIDASVSAIAEQTYPADSYEIVIAVAPSRDGTEAAVRRATAANPRVRVLTNRAGTASAGLNLAVREARGDIIVRIDARTVAAHDYIEQCVEALARSGADNVGGAMVATGNTPFGRAAALAMASWLGSGGARFRRARGEEFVDTVYLGAWRREYLATVGGFDETLERNQDDELNMRIRRRGGRILLTPRIRSSYIARATPRALWRQYFDYGVWKVPVLRKHADADARMWEWRHLAPVVFVVACVAGALIPAAIHLAAGTVVALATRTDWRARAWLPVALLIMPLAYGAGTIAGLYRLWRRGGSPAAIAVSPGSRSGRARRVQTAFARYRRREARTPRWHLDNEGNRAMRTELSRAVAAALSSVRPGAPESLRVLDVGTGLGRSAALLLECGVSPRRLVAVDLLEERLAIARSNCPEVQLQRTDVVDGLPFSSDTFDVACAFTFFSSVEREDDRRRAAREIERVVRPGGAILVYDLRMPSPLNLRVRRVSRRALASYWPDLAATQTVRLTLLPPLARRLGRRTATWYTRLARLPLLRTHTFTVLAKPATRAVADAA